jgi:hypothetical protein
VDLVDRRTVAAVWTVAVDDGADRGAADDGQGDHDGEARQPRAGAHETTS